MICAGWCPMRCTWCCSMWNAIRRGSDPSHASCPAKQRSSREGNTPSGNGWVQHEIAYGGKVDGDALAVGDDGTVYALFGGTPRAAPELGDQLALAILRP